MSGTLDVEPLVAALDATTAIRLRGGRPEAPVELWAELVDAAGLRWRSRGEYRTDATGALDLATASSRGGTYLGCDPAGPFWSMWPEGVSESPIGGIRFQREAKLESHAIGRPELPLEAPVSIRVGARVAGTHVTPVRLTRHACPPGVTLTAIDEAGVVGVLATPEAPPPHPALMILPGSGGGVPSGLAAAYAAHGYAALGLAYFNHPGVSPEMEDIDLEYFAGAIDWLGGVVGHDRIGLRGGSKGGEACLLIGAHFPERVAAIAAYVPSHVMVAGSRRDRSPCAMWRLGGHRLPYVGGRLPETPEQWAMIGPMPEGGLGTPLFLRGMTAPGWQEARIPVERIDCPLMLVAGSEDDMWPSAYACRRVAESLRSAGFAHELSHLEYHGAGHLFTLPNTVMSMSRTIHHPVLNMGQVAGGSPATNAHAARDAWWRTLAFFDRHLREPLASGG